MSDAAEEPCTDSNVPAGAIARAAGCISAKRSLK